MAELIDVACDICGQKYRRSEEDMGKKAKCRICGTKFEIARYVPPDELFEAEQEAALGNPLPWIKGGATFALILLLIGGLGSLLFIKPASARLTTDDASAMRSDASPPSLVLPRGRRPVEDAVARVPAGPLVPEQIVPAPVMPQVVPQVNTVVVEKTAAEKTPAGTQQVALKSAVRSADVDLNAKYQIVETREREGPFLGIQNLRSGYASPAESMHDHVRRMQEEMTRDANKALEDARRRQEELMQRTRRRVDEMRARQRQGFP